MLNPEDFTPEGRKNHYLHPDQPGTVFVLRDGMTLDEFVESLDVPPPSPPPPEPDPRDMKLAELEARLAQVELRTDKIEADVAAELAVKA